MNRAAEKARCDLQSDAMRAAERTQTLRLLDELGALLQRISGGAATVEGSRRRFDALISDMADGAQALRDEVQGR